MPRAWAYRGCMLNTMAETDSPRVFAVKPPLTGRREPSDQVCRPFSPCQRMLEALQCQRVDRPPIWLMRQAGRCLPEYRALRERHSFQELIQTPALAAEVTLQPLRRFHFDAAILFSDILVVPEAMGQGFSFRDKGGVKMTYQLQSPADVRQLNESEIASRLQYVAEAIKIIKTELGDSAALLGFAGSPWTLANFMLEGGSSTQHGKALELFKSNPPVFELLIQKLTRAVTDFLNSQIDAGVDAIQIFDSLGGLLPPEDFTAASGQWMAAIIAGLRPSARVIVYSKGTRQWLGLVATGGHAIAIDHEIDLAKAMRILPGDLALQGNLHPGLLRIGSPQQVQAEASRLLELMRGRDGYIFNLGHGVPPDAKMENLEALAQTVQDFV